MCFYFIFCHPSCAAVSGKARVGRVVERMDGWMMIDGWGWSPAFPDDDSLVFFLGVSLGKTRLANGCIAERGRVCWVHAPPYGVQRGFLGRSIGGDSGVPTPTQPYPVGKSASPVSTKLWPRGALSEGFARNCCRVFAGGGQPLLRPWPLVLAAGAGQPQITGVAA